MKTRVSLQYFVGYCRSITDCSASDQSPFDIYTFASIYILEGFFEPIRQPSLRTPYMYAPWYIIFYDSAILFTILK